MAATDETSEARFSMRTWLGFKWAVDDWGHRCLPARWHRRIFGWLCDRNDEELNS